MPLSLSALSLGVIFSQVRTSKSFILQSQDAFTKFCVKVFALYTGKYCRYSYSIVYYYHFELFVQSFPVKLKHLHTLNILLLFCKYEWVFLKHPRKGFEIFK